MKILEKIIYIFIILLFITILLLFLRGDEDTWICKDGQWIKHGNPSKPMPTNLCR